VAVSHPLVRGLEDGTGALLLSAFFSLTILWILSSPTLSSLWSALHHVLQSAASYVLQAHHVDVQSFHFTQLVAANRFLARDQLAVGDTKCNLVFIKAEVAGVWCRLSDSFSSGGLLNFCFSFTPKSRLKSPVVLWSSSSCGRTLSSVSLPDKRKNNFLHSVINNVLNVLGHSFYAICRYYVFQPCGHK